jgi:hypothetical protein
LPGLLIGCAGGLTQPPHWIPPSGASMHTCYDVYLPYADDHDHPVVEAAVLDDRGEVLVDVVSTPLISADMLPELSMRMMMSTGSGT